jgi:hypothetical protein
MPDFSFIQITDHHLLESEEQIREGFVPGYALRKVMKHIAEHVADKADFIISTGDLVDPATEAAYEGAAKLLGLASSVSLPGPQRANVEGLHNYPMYFLPGNHDDRDLLTRCLFPQSQPVGLYNFTFEHKGVQFVFMDWGPESKAVFLPETRQFLSRALKSDLPSVMICHQQVQKLGSRWLDSFIADEIDDFWGIITQPGIHGKILGILCGHAHVTYEEEYKGIQVLGLRSTAYPFAISDTPLLILAPPHYRFVSIQNNILTSRIYEVPI